MLRKTSASNAWAAIFKNAELFKSFKIQQILGIFLIQNYFLSLLLIVEPSSFIVKPN